MPRNIPKTARPSEPRQTYFEQVWQYIVTELGSTHTFCQTDNAQAAFDACRDHNKPAFVLRVWSDERIYYNC